MTHPFDRAEQPGCDLIYMDVASEVAQIADPTINKWRERIDRFVNGVLKGAEFVTGKEIAEQLAHASWVQSVYSALQGVFEALMYWMHLF